MDSAKYARYLAGECLEDDCTARRLTFRHCKGGTYVSDACEEHGNHCETCFVLVHDGEDFCNEHFDSDAHPQDFWRGRDRTRCVPLFA